MKEVQYGDERVILNKKEGRIEHMDYDGMGDFSRFPSQGRTRKQYEDSAKILAYSLLGLVGMIIVLMIIM